MLQRGVALVALSWLAVTLVASPAQAGEFDEVLSKLKGSHVYVDPASPGVTADTQPKLEARLQKGDRLFLVMLPDSADTASPADLAKRIDNSFGRENIVGIAIGDKVFAYSAIMPAGEAADQMTRAKTVATNTVETIETFVDNIHDWQKSHPAAPASKPAKKSGGFGFRWLLLALLGLVLGIAAWGFGIFVHSSKQGAAGHVKFHSPMAVREILEEIQEKADEVSDPGMKRALAELCRYVDDYFDRAKLDRRTQDIPRDSQIFRGNLEAVRDNLVEFINIEEEPEYYYDPEDEKQKGYKAISDFAAFVLETIRRGNRDRLASYNVNVDILSAKKYG